MVDRLILTLAAPDASEALGRLIARQARSGDAILLAGDLGAGKTTIARGFLAEAAGVFDAPSPTYTLVQSYDGAGAQAGLSILHADLYRVEQANELEELGLDEAFESGVALVEWPDRLVGDPPPDRLEIAVSVRDDGGREARLSAYGSWESRLERIAEKL